jgi:hypothetical protein
VLYPHASAELQVKPFQDLRSLYPLKLLYSGTVHLPHLVRILATLVAAIPEYAKLLLPLLPGIWLALRRPEWRRSFTSWWMLALLASALLAFSVFWQRSSSQVYFLYYGYVAAAALSGIGLVSLWQRRFGDVRLGAGGVLALAAVALIPWAADGPPPLIPATPTSPALYRKLDGLQTWTSPGSNLTPGLFSDYNWLATHTPKDAVLATNNRWIDTAQTDARYFYVSAFARRRTLLEGYYGAPSGAYKFASQAELQKNPRAGTYGDRAAAIQAIFVKGDRRALQAAKARYGVSYLVLDLIHRGPASAARVAALGRVVHRSPSTIVVDVR